MKFNWTNIGSSVIVCVCVRAFEVGQRLVQVQAAGGARVFPSSQLQKLLAQCQLPVGAAAAGVSSTAW